MQGKRKNLNTSSTVGKSLQTKKNCKSPPIKSPQKEETTEKKQDEPQILLNIYYFLFIPVLLCIIIFLYIFGKIKLDPYCMFLLFLLSISPCFPKIKKLKFPLSIEK